MKRNLIKLTIILNLIVNSLVAQSDQAIFFDSIQHVSTIITNNLLDSTSGPVSNCMNSNNFSKWFKFTAVDSLLNIKLKVGDSVNSLCRTYLSLWDDQFNELDCRKYRQGIYNLQIERIDLEIGKTYYIAVDNSNFAAYQGWFELSLDTFALNDYMKSAHLLEHNYQSENAEHSTMNGSPDGKRASCWTTGPNYNKWYAFEAKSSHLHVELLTGDEYGDIEKPYIALWDSLGNELACSRFTASNYNVDLIYRELNIDDTYYISIDNSTQFQYVGSYTLNVYDYIQPGLDEGVMLLLNDVDFDLIKVEDSYCLRIESEEDKERYVLEYTVTGIDTNIMEVYDQQCFYEGDIQSAYYRIKDTVLNDHTPWRYFNIDFNKNKILKAIYAQSGQRIHLSERPSPGVYIYIYEYGSTTSREMKITF